MTTRLVFRNPPIRQPALKFTLQFDPFDFQAQLSIQQVESEADIVALVAGNGGLRLTQLL